MKNVVKTIKIQDYQTILTQNCALKPELPIVVGVSGGADSLFLLNILYRLQYLIFAVYVDHGLRDVSASDGKHVEQICKQWQIPFFSQKIDVQAYAHQQKIPIEEASRELRYHYLFEIAQQQNAQAVAVAHHADDQVETVLMHLVRGSGLSGLRGMQPRLEKHAWHPNIALVRPLLFTWKSEIETYCQLMGIDPVFDESNLDTTYFRNRLRHELIPTLITYNPAFKAGMLRMSTVLQDDYSIIVSIMEDKAGQIEMEFNRQQVIFNAAKFLQLATSMQRMLIRKAIDYLRPALRDVDFEAVNRCIGFVESKSRSSQVDITNHLITFQDDEKIVIMESDRQYIRDDFPLLYNAAEACIQSGEKIPMNNGWFLEAEIRAIDKIEPDVFKDQPIHSAYLDADTCGGKMWVRCPVKGDRFQSSGLNGHSQKVSDIFINQKISRWIRPYYPLIWNESEIIWIPGYRIAESMQISASTKRILVLRFQNEK